MLYISDFYKENKEAVSNQIRILQEKNNGYLLAASVFLDQRILHPDDLSKNKIILTESSYESSLSALIPAFDLGIHYFEEEPNPKRVKLFNSSTSPLFISMYRRPDKTYCEHLLQYKNLKKVFVELESHQKIMIENQIPQEKIIICPTPSLFDVSQKVEKKFNPNNINLLFGSWNGGDMQSLTERGLIYLLKLLQKNKTTKLHILARDNNTELFLQIAKETEVSSQIQIYYNIENKKDLKKVFDKIDIVVFCMPKKVTKDVPNSIIDGIILGKTCIITDKVDFAQIVKEKKLGVVINNFEDPIDLNLEFGEKYYEYQKNCNQVASLYTAENYCKIVYHY